MKVLINDIKRNHAAWIAQKQTSIGSADIPTIIGATDKWRTPLQLWAIKTGREKKQEETDAMWMGRQMEPVIADLAVRKLGWKKEFPNKLYGHDTISWATASPDYFTTTPEGEQLVLECKNVGGHMWRDWAVAAPLAPRAQVIWQCGVIGMKGGIIAPLIGGRVDTFAPFKEDYDQRIFDQIVELAERFFWHVQNDIPPPARAEDTKLVDQLIGDLEEEKLIKLPIECLELAQQYEAAKEEHDHIAHQLKGPKKLMDELKNRLRMAMGDAPGASVGNYLLHAKKITVKPYMNNGSEYTKFTLIGGEQDESEE